MGSLAFTDLLFPLLSVAQSPPGSRNGMLRKILVTISTPLLAGLLTLVPVWLLVSADLQPAWLSVLSVMPALAQLVSSPDYSFRTCSSLFLPKHWLCMG